VVNALSSRLEVEVARSQKLYRDDLRARPSQGQARGPRQDQQPPRHENPLQADTDISAPSATFKPQRLFKMTRSKAYLFAAVEIRWRCDEELLKGVEDVPPERPFHFPGGLKDYLAAAIHADAGAFRISSRASPAARRAWRLRMGGGLDRGRRRLPVVLYQHGAEHPTAARMNSGLRSALLRGLKDHAERAGPAASAQPPSPRKT